MSDHHPRYVVLVQNNDQGNIVGRVLDTWYSWSVVARFASRRQFGREASDAAYAAAERWNAEHDAWLARKDAA